MSNATGKKNNFFERKAHIPTDDITYPPCHSGSTFCAPKMVWSYDTNTIHINGKVKPRHVCLIYISLSSDVAQQFERGEKARNTYPDNSGTWFIVWILLHCRRLKIIILLKVVIYLIMSQTLLTLLRRWAGPEAVSSGVTVPQHTGT